MFYPLTLLFIICTSFNTSNGKQEDGNFNIDKYKAYFIASLIDEFRPDTVWHDQIPCAMPEDIDKKAVREIDSLVNVSFLRLWDYNDIGREGKGRRGDFVLDPLCVAYELLKVVYSTDIDSLARAFEEREMNKQTIQKH